MRQDMVAKATFVVRIRGGGNRGTRLRHVEIVVHEGGFAWSTEPWTAPNPRVLVGATIGGTTRTRGPCVLIDSGRRSAIDL
jgi:hypothetical protein